MQRESSEIPTTLQGKVVAITGVMRTVSRDDLKAALIAAGAVVTGSVNKHTTLLVAGSIGAGSKLEKAKEMGIPIIGEEILQMLREGKFLTGEDRFPAFHVNQVEATEQALANVMAMVMLEQGLDVLYVTDEKRATVLAGTYQLKTWYDMDRLATGFKLVKVEADDALQQ